MEWDIKLCIVVSAGVLVLILAHLMYIADALSRLLEMHGYDTESNSEKNPREVEEK